MGSSINDPLLLKNIPLQFTIEGHHGQFQTVEKKNCE